MGQNDVSLGFAAHGARLPLRPDCVSGFEGGGSTSLKWGSDGELTALDLHGILARLSVHDAQVRDLADAGVLPLA